ncbi:hypothetical protein T4A_5948 [Trichinella pseudospiralis]|uniref:Uncharacterized protein n=1 Tax=Trichinella pseudospiralis TaxID=6337 RepID=A0A0V1EDQ1_TRIPS|nr:hypothetical protein T4A_5948 [Trichinella pseudospiralis]
MNSQNENINLNDGSCCGRLQLNRCQLFDTFFGFLFMVVMMMMVVVAVKELVETLLCISASAKPYQKERVFVWLPSHVMISHVHNSHSACCCTLLKKQTIDAFALNASFWKRRNGRTFMQRVPQFAADLADNGQATSVQRWNSTIIFALLSSFLNMRNLIIFPRPSSSPRRPHNLQAGLFNNYQFMIILILITQIIFSTLCSSNRKFSYQLN